VQNITNQDGALNISPSTGNVVINIKNQGITAAMLANGAVGSAQIDSAQVQLRISGVAPAGSFLTGINQDGTVTSAPLPNSGITGSGANGTIPLWTGTSTQGNSRLTDNGTTLSYSGSNINTSSDYQIGGNVVLSTPGSNTFTGQAVGLLNTGANNTFNGYQSGVHNSTGSCNSFLGDGAGNRNTTGDSNTFIGHNAGYLDTSGFYNTFLGDDAGYNNSTGSYNNFSGVGAGFHNTSGTCNTSIGENAGNQNTTGDSNTFVGRNAGYPNTSGSYNTFTGVGAGYSNQSSSSGSYNTFTGFGAGYAITTGGYNTFIGCEAGYGNTTGSENTTIGYLANIGSSLTNATAIGYGATASASNTMMFGDESVVGWGFGGANPTSSKVFIVGSNTSNGDFAYLSAGGTWTNASSRTLKDRFQTLDGSEVLSKIADLDLRGWYYKGTNEYHIGPIAEDFYNAFMTGDQNHPEDAGKTISSVDPAGVALVGVQELNAMISSQQAIIDEQGKSISSLQREVELLESKIK
jgi:hypothetical protein